MIDVQAVLTQAGADPNAPEGSQGWALAQVAKAHADIVRGTIADAQYRAHSAGASTENWPAFVTRQLREALAQVGAA